MRRVLHKRANSHRPKPHINNIDQQERQITGFVQVMENLESHGIEVFQFPGLESHGI